jgi:hypothetical protein
MEAVGPTKNCTALGEALTPWEPPSTTALKFANDFPQREIDRDIDNRLFLEDLTESNREFSCSETSLPLGPLALAISAKRSVRNAELQGLRATSRRSSVAALLRRLNRTPTQEGTRSVIGFWKSFEKDRHALLATRGKSVPAMLTRRPAGWTA